jgi:hypothetical protein
MCLSSKPCFQKLIIFIAKLNIFMMYTVIFWHTYIHCRMIKSHLSLHMLHIFLWWEYLKSDLLACSSLILSYFLPHGFELRALCLLGRWSTTYAMPPCLSFSSFVHLPHSWGHRCAPSRLTYWQRWVLLTICLGWPQTSILLTSASWIARITGVRHDAWPSIINYSHWATE